MNAALRLEDIDEVMLGSQHHGANGVGWERRDHKMGGLSRHRISSAIYDYVHNPNGGKRVYLRYRLSR